MIQDLLGLLIILALLILFKVIKPDVLPVVGPLLSPIMPLYYYRDSKEPIPLNMRIGTKLTDNRSFEPATTTTFTRNALLSSIVISKQTPITTNLISIKITKPDTGLLYADDVVISTISPNNDGNTQLMIKLVNPTTISTVELTYQITPDEKAGLSNLNAAFSDGVTPAVVKAFEPVRV